MKTSKLKNIIILILLAADLFLLTLVVPQTAAVRASDRATREALCQMLAKNGISLTESTISELDGLPSLSLERDLAAEAEAAALLLGEVTTLDLGGGLYRYDGAGGAASFRSGGDFTVELNSGRAAAFHEPAGAMRTLRRMGLSCTQAETSRSGASSVVTARQTAAGSTIFGCEITLVYDENGLRSVSGRWCAGVSTSRGEATAGAATALAAFLDSREELGFVCSAILKLENGYASASTAGERALTPVWRITTDTGEFQVDAETLSVAQA